MTKISLILLAGGIGTRMQSVLPKQFLLLDNKPIALHSFTLFSSLKEIFEIIVVADPAYHSLFSTHSDTPIKFALPGKRRQDSMTNGLALCSPNTDFICVHDTARPFIQKKELLALFEAAVLHQAAVLGVKVKSTIKQSDASGFVQQTLDRNTLWEIQTPQIATPSLFQQGISFAKTHNLTVTDDVSFVELLKHPVKIVEGSYDNIKLTTPEDLQIALSILESCAAKN